MKIKVGVVDDQRLFLESFPMLINSFSSFEVMLEATNGKDLIEKLTNEHAHPNILLVDVSMPLMDGPETVKYVTDHFPLIRCVALSMKDDDTSIISMLRAGCYAYLLKDIHPMELQIALQEVYEKGYYNGDITNIRCRRLLLKNHQEPQISLSGRELEFLKLACSDLTYKEIANRMFLAERTIDGYRESLFQKFSVKSRVGMALEGLRRNLVVL
jgi:DNA-binding NarL/FixJ family response regulator